MEILLDPTNIYKPFLAIFFSFLVAQGGKMLLNLLNKKPVNILENGGMPSSHTAIIVGIMTTILIEEGFTLLFVVAFFIGLLFIDDAMGVRRETSKHSLFLNDLLKKKRFKIVGHEPLEVLVGAIIGFVVPILIYSFLG